MRKPFVITVDADVPQPGEASIYAIHRETLLAMKYGDSFFLPTQEKVENLVKYARSIGVVLSSHYAAQDEIYVTAGYRLWRVPAEQAEAEPANGAQAKAPEVPAAAGTADTGTRSEPERPEGRRRRKAVLPEQHGTPADPAPAIEMCKTDRYWHAPALKRVIRMQAGMPAVTAAGHVEVSKDEFDRLSAEYFQQPEGAVVGPEKCYVGASYETWWRVKKTGRCVEVPFSDSSRYQAREDMARITQAEYQAWLAQQEEEL